MMAKSPEPGRVEARLALPPEAAADLARAFIEDIWRATRAVPGTSRALAFARFVEGPATAHALGMIAC